MGAKYIITIICDVCKTEVSEYRPFPGDADAYREKLKEARWVCSRKYLKRLTFDFCPKCVKKYGGEKS